jgi:hypothetical protein
LVSAQSPRTPTPSQGTTLDLTPEPLPANDRFRVRSGEGLARWLFRTDGRRERRNDLPKFCRRVKGGRIQLRIHLGGEKGYAVNFGLYPSTGAAVMVRRKVHQLMRSEPNIWAVLARLRATGAVPDHVLPRWVYAHKDESGFGAKARREGQLIHLPGPYPTPEEAFEAMRQLLAAPAIGES